MFVTALISPVLGSKSKKCFQVKVVIRAADSVIVPKHERDNDEDASCLRASNLIARGSLWVSSGTRLSLGKFPQVEPVWDDQFQDYARTSEEFYPHRIKSLGVRRQHCSCSWGERVPWSIVLDIERNLRHSAQVEGLRVLAE